MTIKTKLIANILVTSAIIVGISLAGISTLRFLQGKLSYIAGKSMPLQMKTVELQRDLQNSITDLMRVNTARSLDEYIRLRSEAERSLGNAARSRQTLKSVSSSGQADAAGELGPISQELFSATEARIRSNTAANEINAKILGLMHESSTRLKDLETHIRSFQETQTASFAKALENTGRFSARLRDLEELRNLVKELLSVCREVNGARSTTSFLIVRGKVKTLLARIERNKSGSFSAADFKTLSDDMHEYLQLQSDVVSRKDDESQKWAYETLKTVSENLSRIILTLNQEIDLASSKQIIETQRQEIIYTRSGSADSILLANSELVSLGLTLTGKVNQLFNTDKAGDLNTLNAEIRPIFTAVNERALFIEKALSGLGARDEAATLHEAVASLSAIRSELYSPAGVFAALKDRLDSVERANNAADKLYNIVALQTERGKESVSAARGEQEKAIAAVNSIVQQSLKQTFGISMAAILVGALFGFWIYRSVLPSLQFVLNAVRRQKELGTEKAAIAAAVAGGDLDREVVISKTISVDPALMNRDEMGDVIKAVVVMSEAQVVLDRAFAGMTESLRAGRAEELRRNRLKSGLFELNLILRDEQEPDVLADRALAFIAAFLGAGVGIIYLYEESTGMLNILATYAVARSKRLEAGIRIGEGLVGQAAQERKTIRLDSVPPEYLPVTSALGAADPLCIAIMPVMHNDVLTGVIELGSFNTFSDDDIDFLQQSLAGLAIAININRSRQMVNDLLEQSRQQAEELLQINEELGERAKMLAEQRRLQVQNHDR